MKFERLINGLVAVMLLIGLSWVNCADAADEQERWHVMTIDGAAVGSVQEVEREQNGHWVSTESATLALNRLGSRLEIYTHQRSVESADGKLQSVHQVMRTSGQPMGLDAFVDGDEWVTRSHAEGAPERRQPLTEPLLGPVGIRLRLQQLQAPGDEIEYNGFVAPLGQPGQMRAVLTGFEDHQGQKLRVIEEWMPGMPVALERLVDAQGRNVITRMPGPFGQTRTVLADQIAAGLAESGGELGEDMFRATLVQTGVRLPDARDIEYLELELIHRNPAMGWPALDSDHQRVLASSEDRLVVAIERRHPARAAAADQSDAWGAFLEANALLQIHQPELVALVEKVRGQEQDAWEVARRLQYWVAENMEFDMGVVLAPSSEVLANRSGTCTEYAVLLTALARAAGIPARYVTGYVYAHGIFGGHAWTEVMIDGQWLALDAAIPSEGPADAARLAFLWSDLNDGPGELGGGAALQMFGQIDARVLAWRTAGGSEQRFPDGAPAPGLDNGRFVDRIQGIEWSPPAGWTIVDHDQTWPSNLIAAAEDDQQQRVELRWFSRNAWESAGDDMTEELAHNAERWLGESDLVSGRQAWLASRNDRVHLSVPGRNGYWLLDAPSAELLETLATGLVLPRP